MEDDLIKYSVSIKGTSVDKTFEFISKDNSFVFNEAINKVLELVTEITGETITDDLKDRYITLYNNHGFPFLLRNYTINMLKLS